MSAVTSKLEKHQFVFEIQKELALYIWIIFEVGTNIIPMGLIMSFNSGVYHQLAMAWIMGGLKCSFCIFDYIFI